MKKKSNYLPIALQVRGKRLLIVGGGEVAYKRFCQWQGRGADIKVVAAVFGPEFQALRLSLETEAATEEDGLVTLIERPFQPVDIEGCDLVYIATDNALLNAEIEALCGAQGIWRSRADLPGKTSLAADQADPGDPGDWLSLSLIESGNVQVAIGTGGQSPAVTKFMRQTIEAALDLEQLEKQIELMARLKERLKADIETPSQRAALLRQALGLTIDELERLLTDETIYSRFKG